MSASRRAEQAARILKDLREHPQGLTSAFWPEIDRVAARILELRQAGEQITSRTRDRHGRAVYRLGAGERTGTAAGFREVWACDGCGRTRPKGTVCTEGHVLRPCLIDPDVCAPWPACDLEALQQRAQHATRETRHAA